MFNAYHFFQKLSLQNDGNLQQICKTFFKVAEIIKGRPYDVLDITAAAFDVDFDNIRIVILGLEQQLQDYIDKRFKHTESTEQSLDMLANFQALLDRDSLKPYLNAKHVDVFTNFMHDLDVQFVRNSEGKPANYARLATVQQNHVGSPLTSDD